MQSSDFVPGYDTTVKEAHIPFTGNIPPEKVNAQYCLKPPYAIILATFFKGTPVGQPEIFYAPPIKQAGGSSFASAFNKDVPWFRFTVDGQKIEKNAGYLAIYWGEWSETEQSVIPMPGVLNTQALNYAVVDVQTLIIGGDGN